MSVTTFQGVIENGLVRLVNDVNLPDKTKVYVIVPETEQSVENKRFDLSEMIMQMPSDYKVIEEDFGKPVGKEDW